MSNKNTTIVAILVACFTVSSVGPAFAAHPGKVGNTSIGKKGGPPLRSPDKLSDRQQVREHAKSLVESKKQAIESKKVRKKQNYQQRLGSKSTFNLKARIALRSVKAGLADFFSVGPILATGVIWLGVNAPFLVIAKAIGLNGSEFGAAQPWIMLGAGLFAATVTILDARVSGLNDDLDTELLRRGEASQMGIETLAR